MCAVPISEDEALELAGKWGDPEIRNRTIGAWTATTRKKYGAFGGEKTGRGASILMWVSLGVMLVAVAPYAWSVLQRRRVQRWISERDDK